MAFNIKILRLFILLNSLFFVYQTTNGMTLRDLLPEKEYEALVDLYNSTGGTNWIEKWDLTQSFSNASDLSLFGTGIEALDEVQGNSNANKGNVTWLMLPYNSLVGMIPDSLTNLSKLRILDLEGNMLSGNIPAGMGNLDQLRTLDLADNELSGTIPESLGNLKSLTALNLAANRLSNNVPNGISHLSELSILMLDHNRLTGDIPASLGELTKLTFLRLHWNQLSGNIPDSLANLTQLEYLHLDNNQLCGNIPESLTNLTNLKYVALNDNILTGDVPRFNNNGIFSAFINNNYLNIAIGSQSMSNINSMISGGNVIVYLPMPIHLSSVRSFNGILEFVASGELGPTNVVEISTNLYEWNVLKIILNTNGLFKFGVPYSTKSSNSFYRIRVP